MAPATGSAPKPSPEATLSAQPRLPYGVLSVLPLTRQSDRLLALLLAGALVVGCRGMVAAPPYQATPLPADVTRLFRVFGNVDADTVWIFEQGGPSHTLLENPHVSISGHPVFREIQFVQVHQTLTLNHDLAARHGELSLADLQAEVDVSVEILRRTIAHFKAQGKRVAVIGYSYGAFLTARYLAADGPGAADRYALIAGRLDMPATFVDGALDGVLHHFPNAVDAQPFPVQPATGREFIRLRIMGATAHDRYTERLAGADLQRVLYVYGTADTVVGRLSAAEVTFLESAGSRIIAVPGGNHLSPVLNSTVVQQIIDALQE